MSSLETLRAHRTFVCGAAECRERGYSGRVLVRRPLAALLAPLLLLLCIPSAEAAVKARTSLVTEAGATRIVVALSSSKRLSARKRPRGVSVKSGRRTYKLKRARGSAAAVAYGTWRSKAYSGTAGARVMALAGKRVKVRIRSRAGTTTVRSKVAPPTTGGGGGGGGGSTPLFAKPAGELTGQAAIDHFGRYFFDSRFTDCPAGWPNCAVEERYNHCPNFGWEYHRLTPTSGSDINSYGSYTVSGAAAHADGSWGVEYIVAAYGSQSFYSWNVSATGTVTGSYWAPGNAPPNPPNEALGPLRWQQPAGCS